MRIRTLASLLPAIALVATGCVDHLSPVAPPAASRAAEDREECARPDFVVTDEASLRTALGSAISGQVIAVSGNIVVAGDLAVTTPGLTITCATAGAGLTAASTAAFLLHVTAPNVSIDHLILDASAAVGGSPLFAFNNGATALADSLRFTNNTVTCSPGGECIFLAGGVGSLIADNHFTSPGALSGIQLQYGGFSLTVPIRATRVLRNTLMATAPSGLQQYGAIRTYFAEGLVVAQNVVEGQWGNGISAVAGSDSRYARNRITNPARYGIQLSYGGAFFGPKGVNHSQFVENRVSGAGSGGIIANHECYDRFAGNELKGNAGGLGLIFAVLTGANKVTDYEFDEYTIQNDGAFDCDGDGVNDPNVIVGEDDRR